MIKLAFKFKRGDVSQDITVRLCDVRQVRSTDTPAPWDISVTIIWGGEVAFDHPLSGMDPLHAVEQAAQYAATYLSGRAHDEGGTLDPPIPPALRD